MGTHGKNIIGLFCFLVTMAIQSDGREAEDLGKQTRGAKSDSGLLSSSSPVNPFWEKDPRWRERAFHQRRIYVSARTRRHGVGAHLGVQAMGVVKVPPKFAAEYSKKYHRLTEVSSHFKVAEYDPKKEELFLVTEALRWQARMILKMEYALSENGSPRHGFEVTWGSFKGLKGRFDFVELAPGHTQLTMRAEYAGESLPLPRVLMGVALEVIMQQVAQRMRQQLEKAFNETQANDRV